MRTPPVSLFFDFLHFHAYTPVCAPLQDVCGLCVSSREAVFHHGCAGTSPHPTSVPISPSVFTPRVQGEENIPADFHRIVVVSNHQSTIDMSILGYLYRNKFLVTFKKSLLFYPGLGSAMWLSRYLWVDRSDRDSGRKLIEEATRRTREGESVLFFPEGTRNVESSSALGPFKVGAFKVAVDANATILPVTISGARKIFPSKGIPCFMFGRPTLIIHPPIPAAGKTVEQLRDECSRVIESGLQPIDLAQTPTPASETKKAK